MLKTKVIANKAVALNSEILGWLAEQAILDLSACNTFFTKPQLEEYIKEFLPNLINLPHDATVERHDHIIEFVCQKLVETTLEALPKISLKDEYIYTTNELVDAENDIRKAGIEMTLEKEETIDKDGLKKSLDSYFIADNIKDDDELRTVLPDIVSDNRKLIIVDAPPGSGKSKIFQGFSYASYHHNQNLPLIIATSPSDQAAAELYYDLKRKLSLIGSDFKLLQYNLRILLTDLTDKVIPEKSIIMVDEAGFIGTKDMAKLLKEAGKSNIKVIMVGDSKQIPPLPAGNGFSLISETLIKEGKASVYNIVSIFRQKDTHEKQATKNIRAGNADLALDVYSKKTYQDGKKALNFEDRATEQAINDYVDYITMPDNPDKSAIVLAVDGISARAINKKMQDRLVSAGLIRNPVSYNMSGKKVDFFEADRVIFYQKIRAKEDDKDVVVNAGIRGEVVETSKEGLKVRIADDRVVSIKAEACKNLEKAWCLSMYVAQGISQQRSFLIINKKGKMDLAQGLVAFSRHKKQISAYIDKSAYKNVSELSEEMKVFKSSPIISDYINPSVLKRDKNLSFSELIAKKLGEQR